MSRPRPGRRIGWADGLDRAIPDHFAKKLSNFIKINSQSNFPALLQEAPHEPQQIQHRREGSGRWARKQRPITHGNTLSVATMLRFASHWDVSIQTAWTWSEVGNLDMRAKQLDSAKSSISAILTQFGDISSTGDKIDCNVDVYYWLRSCSIWRFK
jgi:hypothetical protein